MSQTLLRQARVVDTILSKVVLGYDLNDEFTGHHLFPDVPVPAMGGKIIKFGKEAFVIRNTKRAPGETVRSIGFSYSDDSYALENRLLEGKVPEELLTEMQKLPNIKAQTEAVNLIMNSMRREGEYDKAQLATTISHYASDHTQALSGTDMWDNPASNPEEAISDAKAKIRKSTGRYPNVLHLDIYAYEALKRHPKIKEHFRYTGKDSISLDMLATYFDVEKVVAAKALYTPDAESEFTEIWGNNTVLAYVAPPNLRSMRVPSFGYTYVLQGLPKVEKGYFEHSDRSWHYPVLMADAAVLTSNHAGFLFTNTAEIK
ncbi:major capsid protein [Suttonella indologenes]|uniref:Phage major capsid protein E n=1 Tax=Suttonella indologenes TaxID=13276 RepID=A0A380N0M1_9GAMM|nr:major capsid protein [Suttonella indologenes]SUO97663.1 Uncharacterised protein [Suttonella indologenes]